MSRRSEGSIYQVKGGDWRGAISLQNGTRKTIRRKTRSEVAQELRKLLLQRDQNKPITSSKRTVKDFLLEWLEVHIKPNRSHGTYTGYASAVHRHLIPMLGRVKLDALTGGQVQACLNEVTRKGGSPKTVRNVNGALKSALSTAKRWGYLSTNAAKDAVPPRQIRFQAQPLAVTDADKLLGWLTATGHRLEALFYLALMMGFRRGELLGLQWSDVDFARGTIHIQHNCQRVTRKGMVLTALKSEGSDAIVPMPPLCIAALRRRQLSQEGERIAAGAKWVQDRDFVFTSPKGERLDGGVPLLELKHALAVNELPAIRLHDLRHTCASLLLAKRTPMKLIQAIMRHASFQVTMDLYSHLAPNDLQETANVMNDIFANPDATKLATNAIPETVQ